MTRYKTEHGKLNVRRLSDFTQIELLYKKRLKKDFPRNELKPLASMRRSWKNGAYDCYGLFDGDEILGYAFFVRLKNDYLLDYFAIDGKCRDAGLGSIFLRRLSDCLAHANCIIVEVEDPEKAEDTETRALRERRLQFYMRNGCRKTDLTAVVFGADYRILAMPATASRTTEELRLIYTDLYRSVLPRLFFKTQFRTQ